ncbi:MAG TPA: signal peptidase I [Anaerolineae bacterium]|nr:signal peptidase I [Anaerolineae bacterium]
MMENFTEPELSDPTEETSSEVASTPAHPRSVGQILWGLLRDVLETVVPAIVLAFLITHFVGQQTLVLGQSMEPNLYEDQKLVVDKVSYHFRQPERGEIVVVDMGPDELPLIKRVIGLPGETLEIRNHRVLINGEILAETYLAVIMNQDYGPITIPAAHVFVMGDNRNVSLDSRMLGPISLDRITARAWLRVWPLEKAGLLDKE